MNGLTHDFDLQRFHAGDEAFFALLVRDLSPRLLPYLRRYADVDADAHDLLQDVWLRAYSKRKTFDGRGSFFGWLLMVARTVGMDAVRLRARQPRVESLRDSGSDTLQIPRRFAPRDDNSAVIPSEARDLQSALRDAVLSLPDRQRDVVLLRLVEGLSTAETARRLGCAEGTVKATLHQATRKLRELFKETVR